MIMISIITEQCLKNFSKFIIVFFLLSFNNSQSQSPFISEKMKNDFSVSISGNYISSASIQLYSNSNNIVEGNLLTEVDGGYSIGLNLRKRFIGDNIFISVSTEYISIKDDNLYQILQNDSNSFKIDVKEELSVFPLEFSIYYLLPEFFKNTNIYIGGGIGTYFGDRKRQLGPYISETVSKSLNFSMNVLFCAEYSLSRKFAANFEMRFRDASYGVVSRYTENDITINGIMYSFPGEFESKIFIDGLRIGFGLTYFIF